ncbi:SPOR domain-containing protein [bacterium]|nr:SPOR domain-containing protein [bacterium]
MEEPLETLDTVPETQDKLISLMAWLIIACLLFYLALFTFESFFKANQYSTVDENFDVSSSEMILDSSQEISGSLFETEDSFLVNLEDNSLNHSESTLVEVENGPFVVVDQSPMVELNPMNRVNETFVELNQSQSSDSPVLVDVISENIEVDSVNLSNEFSAPANEVFQLKLANTFTNREEAFAAMKQMDFGDLDLHFDLVLYNDVYVVYLGKAIEQSDLSKLENYLSLRNTKTKFSILTQSDVVNIDQEIEVSRDQNVAMKPSVENFRTRAAMIQFTIQIGSFLKEKNAKQLRDTMFQKGFNSDVETLDRGIKTLYKVLVGNYGTRREALEAATELSESDNLPVYVRTVN